MLCLVCQADSVILEIEVDSRAEGKQCLDKVCQKLGIIESDYMGLQYVGPHGDKLWLNLRNQIRRQLSGPPPYRLFFRVKFFVPPHLVLQDVTRHHFYMDVRNSFITNKLHASNGELIKLAALIAQIELGDLNPTQSDSAAAAMSYAKFLPLNCCLSAANKPRQLRVRWRSGGSSEAAKENTESSSPDSSEQEQVSIETDCMALMALCLEVVEAHASLAGSSSKAAIYQFLKLASELDDFGMEQYFAKNKVGETFRIGVGPVGILVHDLNLQLQHSISYNSIHLATHASRCFFLTFLDDTGQSQALGFKLENCHVASALYRAITEKHAFYSCDTVRNAVTSQFIRDLKGTIASLFNENTALGKNYVFDIQRTCREVYDHARRAMYQKKEGASREDNAYSVPGSVDKLNNLLSQECPSTSCKMIQEQLEAFQDSMLCRVCMDLEVGTVFSPCRHVACCSNCAPLCQTCPLCRSQIRETQHVYLPYTGQRKISSGKACSI